MNYYYYQRFGVEWRYCSSISVIADEFMSDWEDKNIAKKLFASVHFRTS